ncbi:MAG: hypothetical protein FWD23_12380 [Oscillospiraceae bacterium]|nr:hypothetical protein [Oscillospiraceae bacterium]
MAVFVCYLFSCALLNNSGIIDEAAYENPAYGDAVYKNNTEDEDKEDLMKIFEITNEFDFSKDYYSQVMAFAEAIAIGFYDSEEFGYTKEEAKNLEIGKPYQILTVVDNNISAQGALYYAIYCNGEIRGEIMAVNPYNGDDYYHLQYGPELSNNIKANLLTEKDFVFVMANNYFYAYCSDNSVIFIADYSYPMTNESSPDDYPKIDFNDISEFSFVNEPAGPIYFDERLVD